MPSTTGSTVLTAVRVVLVVVGFAVTAATAFRLATMPPPPPDSDGFAHGMAAIVGSVILVSSLGVATVSVILPAVLGRPDPLGFDRRQRLALKAAGVLIGFGLLVGVVYGVVSIPPFGVILWLAFVVVAAVIVGVTLLWRLAEALADRFSRAGGESAT